VKAGATTADLAWQHGERKRRILSVSQGLAAADI